MIRLMLALAGLSLTTFTPVTPVLANPVSAPDLGILEFCQDVGVPTYPDLSFGDCVASRTTSNHSLEGWSEHVCFFYQNELPDLFYSAYDDYDDCVRDKASQI